jgi:hypothetical protein
LGTLESRMVLYSCSEPRQGGWFSVSQGIICGLEWGSPLLPAVAVGGGCLPRGLPAAGNMSSLPGGGSECVVQCTSLLAILPLKLLSTLWPHKSLKQVRGLARLDLGPGQLLSVWREEWSSTLPPWCLFIHSQTQAGQLSSIGSGNLEQGQWWRCWEVLRLRATFWRRANRACQWTRWFGSSWAQVCPHL